MRCTGLSPPVIDSEQRQRGSATRRVAGVGGRGGTGPPAHFSLGVSLWSQSAALFTDRIKATWEAASHLVSTHRSANT